MTFWADKTPEQAAQALWDANQRSIGRPTSCVRDLPAYRFEGYMRRARELTQPPSARRVIFDFLTRHFSSPSEGCGDALVSSSPSASPNTCSSTAMAPSTTAAREAGSVPSGPVSQPVSPVNHGGTDSRNGAQDNV